MSYGSFKKTKDEWFNGGFVAVPYEMMDHSAYRELSEAALRVLHFCIRKTNRKGTDRFKVIFRFTYPEAKNRSQIGNSTFRRAMAQLHRVGFIDYYSPGGLRCEPDPQRKDKKKDPKGYQLSLRWKLYGTPAFEKRREGHYVSIHG